jgi:predicted ATPase
VQAVPGPGEWGMMLSIACNCHRHGDRVAYPQKGPWFAVRETPMIKRVHITNFKSLGDVVVHLEPLTVLIGRSGTGKTNFVEALRLLREVLLTRQPGTLIQRYGGWQQVLCATMPPSHPLSIEIEFKAPDVEALYRYRFVFPSPNERGEDRLLEEELRLGERVVFHQARNQWIVSPPVHTPPSAGGVMLGGVTGAEEITIAYLVLAHGLGCYDFPSTVLQQPAQARPAELGLTDDGSNYIQVVDAIATNLAALKDWREIPASLRCLDSSVQGVDLRRPDRSAIQVTRRVGDGQQTWGLSQEGEGFRRFLAHLLAIYQTPPKQTLIFEEPEKGIHPGALAALAEEFKSCADMGRSQVFLTTHSPELLNHFDPDQIRVAQLQDHQTQIGPVVEDQMESLKQQFLLPGELLTVDPARLTTGPVPLG